MIYLFIFLIIIIFLTSATFAREVDVKACALFVSEENKQTKKPKPQTFTRPW